MKDEKLKIYGNYELMMKIKNCHKQRYTNKPLEPLRIILFTPHNT